MAIAKARTISERCKEITIELTKGKTYPSLSLSLDGNGLITFNPRVDTVWMRSTQHDEEITIRKGQFQGIKVGSPRSSESSFEYQGPAGVLIRVTGVDKK